MKNAKSELNKQGQLKEQQNAAASKQLEVGAKPSLEAKDLQRIIEASEEPLATIFALHAATGLRASEALALKVSDLDFKRKTILVRPLKTTERREIPIPVSLEKRLLTFLSRSEPNNQTDWLFSTRDGKPLPPHVLYRTFQRSLLRLGIRKTYLYAFRRPFGSHFLKRPIKRPVFWQITGNRSGTVYLRFREDHEDGHSVQRTVKISSPLIEFFTERVFGK